MRKWAALVVIAIICLWIAVQWSGGDYDIPPVALALILIVLGLEAWYEWKDMSHGDK